MNTPISFLTAKLLKEKGFPLKNTGYAYNKNSELVDPCFSIWECEAPIIAEVVMWLYEKHGIWIQVTPIPYSDNITHWRWEYMSTIYATRNISWKKAKDYMSPTEAYEAAIKYCLEKII